MVAPSSSPVPEYLTIANGGRLAYHRSPGQGPGLVFLSGFMSDMTGGKATVLEAFARSRGQAFLRFDYRGHGQSSGAFREGTIGAWRDDALAALDHLTDGPQILIGSSMGGWLMLLAALARPTRVAGLVGIAAAPDFTEALMWPAFSPEIRETIVRDGIYLAPSKYGDKPYPITMELITDGRDHLVLNGPLAIDAPVRLLQGMQDPDVPYQHAFRLMEALTGSNVVAQFVKYGDHRLSTGSDLARLCATVAALSDEVTEA